MASITVTSNPSTTEDTLTVNFTTNATNITDILISKDGGNSYTSATSFTNTTAVFNVSSWSNGTYSNCKLKCVYTESTGGGGTGGGDTTETLTISNISNITQNTKTPFYIEYSTNIPVTKHEVSWDGGHTFYDKTSEVTSSGNNHKFLHDDKANAGTYKMAIRVTTAKGTTKTSNVFTVTLVDNSGLTFTQYKKLDNGVVTDTTDTKYYSTVDKIAVTPSGKYTLDLNPVSYVCVCFYNSSDTYLGNDSGGFIENNTPDWSVGSLSTTINVPASASYIRICGTSDNTQVTGTLTKSSSGGDSGSGDAYRPGRALLWEDDFTGTTLNTDNWDYENNYSRPNEVQNYVAGTNNVWIEDGKLVIKAKKESSNGKEWSSGCIHTNDKQEYMYGRFEAKIKIPQTVGSFPAFWTLGANYEEGNGITWPYCGEIDIMEHKYGYAWTTAGALYRTDLVWDNWDAKDLGRVDSGNIGSFDDYHIYAMEWTRNKLDYYVDDKLIGHSDISDDSKWFMFHQPHYILLNHALGAAGGSVPSNMTEYTMYVDWVRVYAPEDAPDGGDTANRIWFEDTSARSMGKWSKLGLIPKFNESWTNKVITWKSSDESIATVCGGRVDSKGVAGSCIITATTLNGQSASITVNVS